MDLLLASLPDDLVEWRGTAAELAEKANSLLPRLNLTEDAGSLNERLVRYYVSEKVLTPPEREGREAIFAFRQVIELLVTRYLLRDGWPLAKIAEMVQAADLAALQGLIPSEPSSRASLGPSGRSPTSAEEVVARLRQADSDTDQSIYAVRMSAPSRMTASRRSPSLKPTLTADQTAPPALEMAAELTWRKSALTDNLKALGNEEGRPLRRRTVRIELTPWCQVQINAKELHDISDEAAQTLGTALTQALQEERSRRGEKE